MNADHDPAGLPAVPLDSGPAAPPPSVAVIGGGSWGTALAALLARKFTGVQIWCREPEAAQGINRDHRNPLFLADLDLPPGLSATTDLAEAARREILVMVVPTQFTRAVLRDLAPRLRSDAILVSASKGIEVERLTLVSEIHQQELGEALARRACFLSGPSFAREVVLGLPTAVAIAGADAAIVRQVQELFSTPAFRAYSTPDVVGVELGGALKNVIAIAAGVSDGLGHGYSARAALITRGLAEIVRLGMRLGGAPETFSGLSGLGDLLLTATSELSRNRTVGLRLGGGESLESIQGGMREVAEGVKTAQSVHLLARRLGVEMPITEAVHRILFEGRSPRSAVADLMGRALKPEAVDP